MQLTFRRIHENEVDQACSLMNSVYNRKKQVSYFAWLYYSAPFPSDLYGAFSKNELVAMAGLLQRKTTNSASIGILTDIIVREEHRGKGIFSRLTSYILSDKQLDGVISFTNKQGMVACTKGLGWKVLSRIDTQVLSLPFSQSPNTPLRLTSKENSIASLVHDSKYFDWRFKKSPLYHYTTSSTQDGVYVTKIFQDPTSLEKIGDIVHIAPTNNKAASKLLSHAVQSLQDEKLTKITLWALPHTTLYLASRNLGFESQPTERYLCGTVLNPEFNELSSEHAWDIQESDSEIY